MTTTSQLTSQYDANRIKAKPVDMIDSEHSIHSHDYLESAKNLGAQFVDRTSGIVKENPGYAILGAATVGFLAGAYFFRKK